MGHMCKREHAGRVGRRYGKSGKRTLFFAVLVAAGTLQAGTTFKFSSMTDGQKELLRGQEEMVFLSGEAPEDMRVDCWLTYAKGDNAPVRFTIGTPDRPMTVDLQRIGSWSRSRRVFLGTVKVKQGEQIGILLEGTSCSLKSLELIPLEKDVRLESLLFSAIDYYDKLLRLPNGVYRNLHRINGEEISTGSTATIGVGLISLCINHELGRDPAAREKALQTLRAINGKGGIDIGRDKASGFFLHFFNNEDGTGRSEFSTIDTSIMVSGAICCRNTFQDEEIAREVDELFFSIDWMTAVADREKMKFYTIVTRGMGGKTVTQLFNEYLILAWLCDEHETALTGSSDLMPAIGDLPVMKYKGLEIPTEPRRVPLSSFVIQFPFYMCHPCANDPLYLQYMKACAEADHQACRREYRKEGYWGCGAGQTPDNGYVASSFLDNPGQVVSPRIIAGFMPVYTPAVDTILTYYDQSKRRLKTPAGILLPRFSMEQRDWRPTRIESIDFSSMLFGTAAMHPAIGLDFFQERFRFTVERPE